MERAEYQVARLRGFDRDRDGLEIAQFTDRW
jgi:hypothetical protein